MDKLKIREEGHNQHKSSIFKAVRRPKALGGALLPKCPPKRLKRTKSRKNGKAVGGRSIAYAPPKCPKADALKTMHKSVMQRFSFRDIQ